ALNENSPSLKVDVTGFFPKKMVQESLAPLGAAHVTSVPEGPEDGSQALNTADFPELASFPPPPPQEDKRARHINTGVTRNTSFIKTSPYGRLSAQDQCQVSFLNNYSSFREKT